MNYLDEQIKRFIKACEDFDKKVDEVMPVLYAAKVLSDLDKHMAVYYAEMIIKEADCGT